MFQENITQTFIVLNTNLYYNNKAKTVDTDPCGQVRLFYEILLNFLYSLSAMKVILILSGPNVIKLFLSVI
jgi:hypothetical protein